MSKTINDHVRVIREVLMGERFMREQTFKKNPAKMAVKVREIDEANKSLIALQLALHNAGLLVKEDSENAGS